MATVDATTDAPRWAQARDYAHSCQAAADTAWQEAFYYARLEGHLDEVVSSSPYSMTSALALTRAENEARGRSIRWRDGR